MYLTVHFFKKKKTLGNSLVVQWLGRGAFTARAWVQSLVGGLRFHKVKINKALRIFFNIYSSVVDVQYYATFRYTAKYFSCVCVYIYIYVFSIIGHYKILNILPSAIQ